MYAINRSVARRYFAQAGTVIPEPADDAFEIQKPPGTKRIFCLGESTMAGFPYDFNATAPSLLGDLLQQQLPGTHFEIVNLGLSAVGSTIVREFVDEILDYDPDLLILYVGHNEFYGAFGVGSTVSGGGSWLTRAGLYALKSKTYLFFRDIYVWIARTISPLPRKNEATLMGQVVGNQQIPFHSALYDRARSIYSDNLAAITRTARSHGVPVLFSTLVSNLRTQPPFVPLADSSRSAEWQRLMAEGDRLRRAELPDSAFAKFRTACRVDSMNASGWFAFAQAAYTRGKYPEALAAFEHARDLDALRFRMSSEFQDDLIEWCRSEGVPLARVDSAFSACSAGGIVGNELVLEHLHPNLHGYLLMAKTWRDAIKSNGILVESTQWRTTPEIGDDEQLHRSAVTAFDSLVGAIKVKILTHSWPFAEASVPFEFTPTARRDSIVYDYIRGKRFWSDARYALAEAYARARRYDLARDECLAVAKVASYSFEPLLRVADYYDAEGLSEQAKQTYRASYERQENPFARLKLAVLLLQGENPRGAIAQIDRALELDRSGNTRLKADATAGARYLLGVAYAKLGEFSRARQELEHALLIRPDDPEAKDLLSQIDRHVKEQ
jgi:tetratricopeptide (TPR) repeat protein